MRRHSGAVLALAIGVSLAAHALVFWLVPWREKLLAPKPQPRIETALIELPAPPGPLAPAVASRVREKPQPVRHERASTPAVKKVAAPEPHAELPVAVPLPPATPADAHAEPPAIGGDAIATMPGRSSGSGGDAGLVASAAPPLSDDHAAIERIQEVLKVRARLCYPRSAARLGLAGVTRVHFCVADGSASDITVLSSSGEHELDHAATDCVVGGARALPALQRCLEVLVVFANP